MRYRIGSVIGLPRARFVRRLRRLQLRVLFKRLLLQPLGESRDLGAGARARRAHEEVRARIGRGAHVAFAEGQDELALLHPLADEAAAAERDALAFDRRLHQLIVMREAQHA